LSFPVGWVGRIRHLSGNGDLNLNTSLDVDDDLLDDLGGGVKVDQALVDPVIAVLSARSSSEVKRKQSQANAVSQQSQKAMFPGNCTSRSMIPLPI
jgi:hypothetical protein